MNLLNDSLRVDEPIFIIGSPRSGTTLLRLMLSCHPKIVIPPECGYIQWLSNAYGNWRPESNGGQDRVTRFLDDLEKTRKFRTWDLDVQSIAKAIHARKPANYVQLCACVAESYATEQGKRPVYWGDKNNYYVRHLPELLQIFKNGRFVHLVRDGRDIACSYRAVMRSGSQSPFHPDLPTEIEIIAREWRRNVIEVDTALTGITSTRHKSIRYEDMTQRPDAVLRDICAWLELNYDQAMTDFHRLNHKNTLEPTATMDWKLKTLQPVDTQGVGRFENELTSAEISLFEKTAADALQKFGYRVGEAGR